MFLSATSVNLAKSNGFAVDCQSRTHKSISISLCFSNALEAYLQKVNQSLDLKQKIESKIYGIKYVCSGFQLPKASFRAF